MSKPIFRRDKPHDHPMTKVTPLVSEDRVDTFIRNHVPLEYKPKIGVYSIRELVRDAVVITRDIYEAERSALLREVERLEKENALLGSEITSRS